MKKTVMITGATSGFGWAMAVKFAANGFNLIITGRRQEKLNELSEVLNTFKGIKILPLCFDVRDRQQVGSVISGLSDEWKAIGILVNNAGLAVGMEHIDEGNIDDWERMIDTNIKGLLFITRAVSPLMVARNTGHIINIASIAGKENYEYGNVYCATKAAVDSLSKSMRIDLLRHNIKITNIAPGMAETEFSIVRFKGDQTRADAVYKGIDPLTGEDIADVVFFCATLPAHVCINDIVITPTQQAGANHSFRRS
jgi:3-hydroxy acid dehydrogenase / malonic semialdehyde reductase